MTTEAQLKKTIEQAYRTRGGCTAHPTPDQLAEWLGRDEVDDETYDAILALLDAGYTVEHGRYRDNRAIAKQAQREAAATATQVTTTADVPLTPWEQVLSHMGALEHLMSESFIASLHLDNVVLAENMLSDVVRKLYQEVGRRVQADKDAEKARFVFKLPEAI